MLKTILALISEEEEQQMLMLGCYIDCEVADDLSSNMSLMFVLLLTMRVY